jgi:transcriptional/translational regulatory protein YebC/TACO1
VILVDGERLDEDDLIPAIDAGAEDVSEDGDLLKITTAASDLAAVRSALEGAGVEVQSAEVSMEPKSTVQVGEGDAPALLRLMDALEDQDDVDSVHANFDVPEEILERAAATS